MPINFTDEIMHTVGDFAEKVGVNRKSRFFSAHIHSKKPILVL